MRLIDAEALKEDIKRSWDWKTVDGITATTVLKQTLTDIDNAPTVFDEKAYSDGYTQGACDCEHAHERPQGKYVDISKLRLMTVEECAGHTIDYALGWKACIEWIKKGGAE